MNDERTEQVRVPQARERVSRSRGFGSIYRRRGEAGKIWWIAYRANGKRYAESSMSTVKQDAKDLLEQRRLEIRAGRFTGHTRPTSFDELVGFLTSDYKKKQNKSARRALQCVSHLRRMFERLAATAITFERMDGYVSARLDEGAAHATVRQEIAVLGRMLTLAVRAGRLAVRPSLPEIEVSNTRKGFFEPAQFAAVLSNLPEHLRPVALFAYLTGWRRGEILSLKWADVDFETKTVRLEPGTTKNGEGRVFPFGELPELAALMREQRDKAKRLERELQRVIPHVFPGPSGRRLSDFYGAWRAACRQAGVPGLIFHDLRRTAVRNFERAGIARSVAMKLTGHRTEAVYRRYAIVSAQDLAEAVQKLARSSSSATIELRSEPRRATGRRPDLKDDAASA